MKKAFTLIELMVTIALLAVTVSGTLASFLTYNRRQAVVAASEKLRQTLLEARANAVAGKIDCSECGGADNICNGADTEEPLEYWWAGVASNCVRIYGYCDAIIMQKDTCFNPGITISSTCPGSSVQYQTNGSTNLSLGSVCSFTVSWGIFNRPVSVEASGLVN